MADFLGLWLISYIGGSLGFLLAAMCIACGLYYLAELIEENTMLTKRVLYFLITTVIAFHFILLVLDDLPVFNLAVGIVAHCVYFVLLPNFPFIELLSVSFIGACVLMAVDHFLWFQYFGEVWHPFSHVMGFFGLCVWMVPFIFFISLSANESALPMPGGLGEGKPRRPGTGLFKTTFDMLRQQPQSFPRFNAEKRSWE